ncbi:histone-like nucleoid-structuring protein Lsr2 [Streptomyces tsukubensis]|uniref:Lsr2 family DNA-binding protein n=1 Tax=Streptomyces tsukubensis TaxID=83656 RepID=UPI0036CDBDB1
MKTTPVVKMEFESILGRPYMGLVEITDQKHRAVETQYRAYKDAEEALAKRLKARDDAAAKLIRTLNEIGVHPVRDEKLPPEKLAKIRQWANRNGHEVKPKSRIPVVVKAAYDKAAAAGELQPDERI